MKDIFITYYYLLLYHSFISHVLKLVFSKECLLKMLFNNEFFSFQINLHLYCVHY